MTKAFLFFLLEIVSFKTAGRPSVLALAVFSSIQKAATQKEKSADSYFEERGLRVNRLDWRINTIQVMAKTV